MYNIQSLSILLDYLRVGVFIYVRYVCTMYALSFFIQVSLAIIIYLPRERSILHITHEQVIFFGKTCLNLA